LATPPFLISRNPRRLFVAKEAWLSRMTWMSRSPCGGIAPTVWSSGLRLSSAGRPPYQAGMSDLSAALGLAQLKRLDEILERRRFIEHLYYKHVQSFEGIKDPFVAPEVTEMNWFLYIVHLGTRFSRSSRDAIIEDLRVEQVEAAAYSSPLHLQRHYFDLGYRRGNFLVTEKVADRAVALPFHTHLAEDQIAFLVATMKDASINVGAGAAIY
jgi:perosamine synthetase